MLLAVSNVTGAKTFAQSAMEQLEQAAGDSDSAANSYSGGSFDYVDARDMSGYGFDTPSSSPPPVDLRDAGDHPTPMLLRDADD